MLTKQQAAEYLEKSIRSLERYTRQGRIGADYAKGQHNKPTPMYGEDDLEALKAQIQKRRRSANPTVGDNPVVAFRLPPPYADRLRQEGEQRGLSAGECARLRLIDALEDIDRRRFTDELKRAVEILGADLCTSVLVLLLRAGQVEDEAEARSWIEANLKCVRKVGS